MGLIGSVVEGIKSLGESVGHAVQGEWKEAGKDFAKAGLEAAGIAGSALVGPQMEALQERIETGLDSGILEEKGVPGGAGDVPAPSNGSPGGVASIFAGGEAGSVGGMGVDTLLERLDGGIAGPGGSGAAQAGFPKLAGKLQKFFDGSNLLSELTGNAGEVGAKILSSVL